MSCRSPASSNDNNRSDVYSLLQHHREQSSNATALLAPGRNALTYGALGNLVDEVIHTFSTMGIGSHDRVAMVLSNGPEMATAFLAVGACATAAPLNPDYGTEAFRFYLSDLKAKAVIVHGDIDSPVRQVARENDIGLIELSPALDKEAGRFALSSDSCFAPVRGGAPRADDIALVLHTSGTTSRPKIVPLTGANICVSAKSIVTALQLDGRDCCLNVMPLFHIHGLIGAVLSSMAAGASIVCTPGFQPSKFFEWLELFHPSWYTAVPTMHQAVLSQAKAHHEIIQQCPLRFIRSCSADLPPRVMKELQDYFDVPVVNAYGMTEAAHQMTSNPLPPGICKPSSVGVAAGPEVAIMDTEGQLLAADEKGEIVIRGANVTSGYQDNAQANRQAFTQGWFRTGDQGYLDRDGYLFLTGRIKEIINRGGVTIAPNEVDAILLEHPAVAQAVTFAVAHPTLGEDVVAAVVLKESLSITAREMREFALSRLTWEKVPSQVLIVNAIPKGPTGKLQRIGLAEQFVSKLQSAYTAPQNTTEKALVKIWSEVLRVERIGTSDNFFRIGGNSLLATQVISRARKIFQVELPLDIIFRDPTPASQADRITEIIIKEVEEMSEEEARQALLEKRLQGEKGKR